MSRNTTNLTKIRIGTAGWSIPRQYAARMPVDGTHLERYSRAFNCAEINSSFYRSHRLSTWAKWAANVPADFCFSVKAPKAITHEHTLACSPQQLKSFLEEAQMLGGKLGPILFQLPPSFAFDELRASYFFTMLRDLYAAPVALEPRHPTWFSDESNRLLQKFQIARVAADPPITPQSSEPAGSSQLIYHRLHGSPRIYYSAYGPDRLASLADQIAAGKKSRQAAEVWVIFDNTASGAAIEDAETLQRLIAASTSPESYRSPPAPVAP